MTAHGIATSRLIDAIVAEAIDTAAYTGRRTFRRSTLNAIAVVDRAVFVETHRRADAYENRPLAIGHGQTISQPFVVALMTDLLDVNESSLVLEVGTGSGYQAAILGRLAGVVQSLEIIPTLADDARRKLARLGYDNVHVHHGNGWAGRAETAPYDAIMVTAAARRVPSALIEQLRPGGKMVIPVDTRPGEQSLRTIRKHDDGTVSEQDVLPVIFVPLTGEIPD